MTAVALPSLPLDVKGGPGVTIKREGGRVTISVDVVPALDTVMANLPASPNGLAPGRLWRNGDPDGGYLISQAGTGS